ncbi:MAG: metallophosphoesterase, partial [Gemmatimonadota bacterium]|nr:metallophosphoesterase [Gemmatimonadota bacterium]
MRTIFVGDVHGCAAEFEAFLEKVDYSDRDRLLLTGDAFARGPDPLAVWKLICDTEAEMVLGNHDARLLKQLIALGK